MAIVLIMLGVGVLAVAGAGLLAVANVIAEGPQPVRKNSVKLPHHFSPLTVTPPVVFDIAETLRRRQTPERVRQIENRAARNVAQLGDVSACSSNNLCPLQCDSDSCVAAPHATHDCLSQCPLFGESVAATTSHKESGLSEVLSSVGLDGHRYELNAALEVALKTPDAARRWAHGENVFAGCRQFDV